MMAVAKKYYFSCQHMKKILPMVATLEVFHSNAIEITGDMIEKFHAWNSR
jgi:hypothetical protein